MRPRLVVGNWKMNGNRERAAALLYEIVAAIETPACGVVVCPPSPLLSWCAAVLDGSAITVGAQDVSEFAEGAYTGDVSATMLREAGCDHVLVGHSERRGLHGESDEVAARKAARALATGLAPIVCVGETLDERAAGVTEAVLDRQVRTVLALVDAKVRGRIVFVYEPRWAGADVAPAVAQDAHAALRRRIAACDAGAAARARILYGGIVRPDNAAALFAQPDIDGALVGGAALDAQAFAAIVRAASAPR